jgi:hypothetical protein
MRKSSAINRTGVLTENEMYNQTLETGSGWQLVPNKINILPGCTAEQ